MSAVLLGGLGGALLLAGGEFVVRGSVVLARRLGFPKLLIGLVVVGFATSLPELVVSLDAVLGGSASLAVGNIIGSTIANLLLILGAAALAAPVRARSEEGRVEAFAMNVAVALLLAAAVAGGVSRIAGFVAVAGLGSYLAWSYVNTKRKRGGDDVARALGEDVRSIPLGTAAALTAAGLAGLVAGGQLVVTNGVAVARLAGVPEAVIGLTAVAVGTSLPELATTIISARRGHPEIAVGNVLGSNLFNILGILGVTAIVRPFSIEPNAIIDAAVALVASALLLPVLAGRNRLGRTAGAVMLGAYTAYVVTRFL